MTTVIFYGGCKRVSITYIGYNKNNLLKLAKRYGIDNDYYHIYIPDYQIVLVRRGIRWFQ